MSMSGREAALKALASFRKNGAWSQQMLDSLIKSNGIDQREAALASRITYGVLQNYMLIDHYIAAYSKTNSKTEPIVSDILRLSVYQIVFLDRIPARSAVDEGVKLTKKYANARASGYVNAVLRRVSENRNALPEVDTGDPLTDLSVKYSHPLPLVREYAARLGADGAEALLKANNEDAGMTIVTNTLNITAGGLMKKLADAGISAERSKLFSDSLEIKNAGSPEKLEAFSNGDFFVQDNAARAAVEALSPKEGATVMDVCSCPGGKSFMAALMMNGKGRIISCDIHEKKLPLVKEGARRLGIGIIETRAADASEFIPEFEDSADYVIADVPCSGFGVVRKKPEIRYKPIEETEGLPEIQYAILENVSRYVKRGGKLLYSTCTVLRRENEDVFTKFLASHPEFEAVEFNVAGISSEGGMLTMWQHVHNTDGFFMGVMRRRETD